MAQGVSSLEQIALEVVAQHTEVLRSLEGVPEEVALQIFEVLDTHPATAGASPPLPSPPLPSPPAPPLLATADGELTAPYPSCREFSP